MKNIVLLFLLITVTASCQDFGKLKIIESLPTSMDEISGIEKLESSPLLWMVNDKGNSSHLFGYNVSEKTIERNLNLESIKNNDWEDLATDGKNTLYIGDFGNNNNKRKKLAIYTVANVTEGETAIGTTTFHYEDQTEFPPKKKNRNFDAEAFIYMDDYFYVFTRNRSHPFDGTTKLYKVPAKLGDFEAKLIGSYKTCEDRSDCQITSATINHTTGTIALLSYNKIWLLSDYEGDAFFKGTVKKIKLNHKSQKESITFKDSNTLYIADERNGIEGGNLYELALEPL